MGEMQEIRGIQIEQIFSATVHVRLYKPKKSADPDEKGASYYTTLPKEIRPRRGEVLTLAILKRTPPERE